MLLAAGVENLTAPVVAMMAETVSSAVVVETLRAGRTSFFSGVPGREKAALGGALAVPLWEARSGKLLREPAIVEPQEQKGLAW